MAQEQKNLRAENAKYQKELAVLRQNNELLRLQLDDANKREKDNK